MAATDDVAPVRVEVSLTLGEYIDAVWGIPLLRLGIIGCHGVFSALVLTIVLVGACFYPMTDRQFRGMLILAGTSTFLTGVVPLAFFCGVRFWFHRILKLQEPRTYLADADGIHRSDATCDAFTPWHAVAAARRVRTVLFLRSECGERDFIPVRAFRSEADYRGFLRIVGRRVDVCHESWDAESECRP